VIVAGSLWLRNHHLAVRDLLRANPVLRAEYAAVKRLSPPWRVWDGDRMRRRGIGAALTIVGVLAVVFVPVVGVGGCADCIEGAHDPICGCHDYGSYSLWGLIHYPPGWDKLALPMLIIGVALVVTGIVLLIKARRTKFSPGAAR